MRARPGSGAEGRGGYAAGELGRALLALGQRALDLLFGLRLREAGQWQEQKQNGCFEHPDQPSAENAAGRIHPVFALVAS